MMLVLCLVSLSLTSNLDLIIPAQPDTSFKSIHRLQSEEYKKDTINNKSTTENQSEQAMFNFSLLILIIILLIFFATVFLIARRIYLVKK
ncbi:MAG: hypothetical protein N3A65_09555 [candidate division WOR-3 bacterium]|nr:hypothetical protein [candidate division WOR-3 bacterium]